MMSDRNAAAHIEIERVSLRYPSLRRGQPPIVALDDVSLRIPRGDFVALVGPSGCGKSTLLRLVAGLLPPTSGTIRLNAEIVSEPRSDVGIVFQRPTLLPWRSVRDNILLPANIVGAPRQAARERAESLLDLVGLGGFADRYPAELSGGMQQRVAIARALLLDPDVLLMDEPFAALDALLREDLAVELERIWLTSPERLGGAQHREERKRPTILFVTHSITEAVMLADTVVVLSPRPGTVIGTVPVRLLRPRGRELLDSPELTALAQRVRHLLQTGSDTAASRPTR